MKRIDISTSTHEQLMELSLANMRPMTVELAIAVNARWSLLQKSSTGSLAGDLPWQEEDTEYQSNGKG